MDDNKQIWYIPVVDKPIKLIFEELHCPILLQLDEKFRCKYVKSKTEDMNWVLYCSYPVNDLEDKCPSRQRFKY